MATNGKGTGIVGYNGKKGRSAWRIRSASGRRGRGVEFAPDSLLEQAGFEPSVPPRQDELMRLMHAKRCVQRSTAWAGQAREIVFDGRGVTRTTTADAIAEHRTTRARIGPSRQAPRLSAFDRKEPPGLTPLGV